MEYTLFVSPDEGYLVARALSPHLFEDRYPNLRLVKISDCKGLCELVLRLDGTMMSVQQLWKLAQHCKEQ